MSGYGPVPFLYSKDVASVPCKGPKIKIASFENIFDSDLQTEMEI
jgi:hypothetical protein